MVVAQNKFKVEVSAATGKLRLAAKDSGADITPEAELSYIRNVCADIVNERLSASIKDYSDYAEQSKENQPEMWKVN